MIYICSCRRTGTFEKKFEPALVLVRTSCEKNEGAFGKNAGPLESAFPGETNAFAFALHLYRFSHGQSYFSPKKFTGPEWGPDSGSKRGVHVLSTPNVNR